MDLQPSNCGASPIHLALVASCSVNHLADFSDLISRKAAQFGVPTNDFLIFRQINTEVLSAATKDSCH